MNIDTKYLSAISAIALTIIGILTYIKQREELEMKRTEHALNTELTKLKLSALKSNPDHIHV